MFWLDLFSMFSCWGMKSFFSSRQEEEEEVEETKRKIRLKMGKSFDTFNNGRHFLIIYIRSVVINFIWYDVMWFRCAKNQAWATTTTKYISNDSFDSSRMEWKQATHIRHVDSFFLLHRLAIIFHFCASIIAQRICIRHLLLLPERIQHTESEI